MDMEPVGSVMRLYGMLHISQKPRRFITGGLNSLTVQLDQGRCHEVIPGLLVAILIQLFQDHEIA